MRFGYSLHGFLSDVKLDRDLKEISTPDGNATYSYSILYEAHRRGWKLHTMMPDRDAPMYEGFDLNKYGLRNMFNAFSKDKRIEAYMNSVTNGYFDLPELDVLLLEWRWPIPGRNCDVSPRSKEYQPDLDIQRRLLEHYKTKDTKVIFFDLDYKLTLEDEAKWKPDAVFETSVSPRRQLYVRTKVEPPTIVDDLLQHPTLPCDPHRKLVYVGSRYERDDVIEEYMQPASECWQGEDRIEFWGNWTRPDTLAECKKMWPKISYNGRITTKDFRRVYGTAVACPLLAKRSYIASGFVTPRVWEALLFGTIPIGLAAMTGIKDYVLFTARDALDFVDIADYLSSLDVRQRDELRRENADKIKFMDASNFVDKIQEVVDEKNVRTVIEERRE